MSPASDRALTGLVERGESYDRLDVLAVAPTDHVCGWRPYAGEAEHKSVNFARFVDGDHVVTNNEGGKLVKWKIPDCKAVYVCEGFGKVYAASPNGRYLLGVQSGAFRLFNTDTGEFVEAVRAIPEALRTYMGGLERIG